MSNLDYISIYHPWMWDVLVVILGLCVGSFLNVCIFRMPRGLSVVSPRSFCPKSKAPLKWWDNIPVVSFLLLGGKGRESGKPISWQYPAVEILTGVLFFVLWKVFGAQPGLAIAYMVMTAMMIAGSFIDWQFKIIPDSLTVGGAFVGLVLAVAVPSLFVDAPHWELTAAIGSLGQSLQGMLIGSGVVLWIALLAEMALKKEAMGFGDVKLLGMLGAFIGWKGAIFAIFGGAFVGMAVVLVSMVIEKFAGKKEKFMGREIPFGPMLNVAALAFVLMKGCGVALRWGL